jgi:hypothetical protein
MKRRSGKNRECRVNRQLPRNCKQHRKFHAVKSLSLKGKT